jgi:DNA modification methylase
MGNIWGYKEEEGVDILGGKINTLPTTEIYGFLPISIWDIGKKEGTLRSFMKDDIANGSYSGDRKRKTALSEMHPEVIQRCIKYWSLENDTIFDPFAGRGTRAVVSKSLKRNYIGQDISKEFYEHIKSKFKQQLTLTPQEFIDEGDKFIVKSGVTIQVTNQDSRIKTLNDNSCDMIITSPPYWNIEFYGDEKGQLYFCETYQLFLSEMKQIVQNCYSILKEGRFCVWIVNDIRREGRLIGYHSDTIKLFEKCGFNLHDVVIYNLNTPGITGLTRCDRSRYTVKSHEYILVFRKGGIYPTDKQT